MRTEIALSRRFRQEWRRSGLRTLVSEVGSEPLVEVEWQVLDPDDLKTPGHALGCAGEITRGHTKGVNGVVNPTFAMIVITICSLRLNLPGLKLHV